jgi:hypothetical protein
MDFKAASKLGSLISKDYAEAFLGLLVTYRDISASEAASRLDLHIKTAQDFLEGLCSLGIVSRKEVFESTRPYFRYSIETKRLSFDIDLSALGDVPDEHTALGMRIRERKNSGAIFKPSGSGDRIASVHFFTGKGRGRTERRLSVTKNQGTFLFHLPFPTEPPLSIEKIIEKAGIDPSYSPEILDIVDVLTQHRIIEMAGPPES